MKKTFTILVVMSLWVEACGGHIQFPPTPDRSASRETRVAAYNRYRPTEAMHTQHLTVNRYGQVLSASTSLNFVMLADGTQVAYPEDLSPLVNPTSVTAQAARESANFRAPAAWLYWGGAASTLAGLALLIPAASASADEYDARGMRTPGDDTLFWTSVAVMSTGLVAMLIGGLLGTRSSSERQRAFMTYDTSLRERLGLCGDGTQIGDCPNADASAAPPGSQGAAGAGTF